MIGKIMTGKSFRGCIKYCLNDKLADEKKNELVMTDRAEVIAYNLCYGNEKELIQQFNEVRQLNRRQSKPVLHVTLSLANGEDLPHHKLAEIAQDCAKDLGFNDNQYVAVLHKDTGHPHLHIIANRIGFDGKTISDSNNYQKIAKLCRKMELKHQLTQVQSPNAFLPKELRNYQLLDERKLQLKTDIKNSLARANNFGQFEQNMQSLKYEVIKMRGIAFRDEKKVYTKGSEVGYSLATIEKIIVQKQTLKIEHKHRLITRREGEEMRTERPEKFQDSKTNTVNRENLLDVLLKPDTSFEEGINYDLLKEERKRRRKQKQQHL